MLTCVPMMLHTTGATIDHDDQSSMQNNKKKPLMFLSNIFKKKKGDHEDVNVISNDVNFQDASLDHGNGNCKSMFCDDNVGIPTSSCSTNFGRVASSLSVHAMEYMDIVVHPVCSSTLTLTPGRTRNIDRDMEALRLSRQDNPFLQVLASRENLVDALDDNESDAAVLMSHDQSGFLEQDPLSLPEVHEHMIRSPPPTTWPRSPNSRIFHFPSPGAFSDFEDNSSQESLVGATARIKSPARCNSQPSPKRSRSVIETHDNMMFISPGDRSPDLGGMVAGNRMTGRLSLTPKPPRRCSSDSKGCTSGFSLLQAPKRAHQDEEELLVAPEKTQEIGSELEPIEFPILQSPARMS